MQSSALSFHILYKTVQDRMTPDPITLPETASLLETAHTMRDARIGNVVVLEGETICGIVTDRDIVVRGIADGRDPETLIYEALFVACWLQPRFEGLVRFPLTRHSAYNGA